MTVTPLGRSRMWETSSAMGGRVLSQELLGIVVDAGGGGEVESLSGGLLLKGRRGHTTQATKRERKIVG